MSETKRPLHLTGEEIERTFGDHEVRRLEESRDLVIRQLAELRTTLAEHWDDPDLVEQLESQISNFEEQLRALMKTLRAKRGRFDHALESTQSLPPVL
ncbi:hypothetical protein HZA85_00255 [Candidatus Uhrbacteria bacterium]|nr:hypothetical protein [Candidatus Uhrbacteria bacterium]